MSSRYDKTGVDRVCSAHSKDNSWIHSILSLDVAQALKSSATITMLRVAKQTRCTQSELIGQLKSAIKKESEYAAWKK